MMQLSFKVAVCALLASSISGLAPNSRQQPAKKASLQEASKAVWKKVATTALAGIFSASSLAVVAPAPPAYATPPSNAATSQGSRVNKDPESLLRNGLPIDNREARELQRAVEEISNNLRSKRISAALGDVENAKRVVKSKSSKIAVGPRAGEISERLDSLVNELTPITAALKTGGAPGSPQERAGLDEAGARQLASARLVSEIEARLVPEGFKAVVPEEYSTLPRLDGRARVEFIIRKGPEKKGEKFAVDSVLYDKARLELVVDGYTAPLTSGNFLDLINKKFYDGMPIQRSDGFVVQTGDPDGAEGPLIGYTEDGKIRRIPLEIQVEGDKSPMYGSTTEDDLRGAAQTKLKFQAYGALGMARDEYDADSASSQWFWLLFDSDLTPAGKNLLDGRYSCFGYTLEGEDFLGAIGEGDVIESARIIRAPPPFGSYTGLDP